MTYIASIPAIYSDACITYATLSVSYFVLSKNAPFSYRSALWKRVVFGLLAGGGGAVFKPGPAGADR